MLWSLIESLFKHRELSPEFIMELMVFMCCLLVFDCIMSMIRKM